MKDALVIILYDHPWEHTSDYAHQTSEYMSKHNLVIGVLLKDAQSVKEMIVSRRHVWFWKKVKANYYVVKPMYIIPFRRFQIIVAINVIVNMFILRLMVSFMLLHKTVQKRYLWIFNPQHYAVMKLFVPSFMTIYDCVDYHGETDGGKAEKELLQSSDWVFVNSRTLLNIHKKIRRDSVLVPLGFDEKTFSKTSSSSTLQLPRGRPIIGYIGGINSRLNFPLLTGVIQHNPQYNFVFIGPTQKHEHDDVFYSRVKPQIDALYAFQNVHHYDSVSRKAILSVIKQFSVCMIPYDTARGFNKFCFPMKVFEYFYAGKPVISTTINELRRFPRYVKIGDTIEDWEKHIASLITRRWPESYQREERRLAEENSWERKINTQLDHITVSDQ